MGNKSSTRSASCRRVMKERWAGRREYWQNLMDRYETRGISITAFCKEENVHPSSFYSWRRRLQEDTTAEEAPKFVSLQFSADDSERPTSGVSVRISDAIRVELDKGFSSEDLLRAVQVLRAF